VLFGMSKSSTLWTSRSFVFPFISSLSPRDAQIGAMIDEVLTMLEDQQDKGVFCVCKSTYAQSQQDNKIRLVGPC
jgi:hypothetical protein